MENVLHMLTHSHNIGPFYNSIRGSPAGRNVEDTKIGRLSVIHKQHANIHLPCSPDKSRENLDCFSSPALLCPVSIPIPWSWLAPVPFCGIFKFRLMHFLPAPSTQNPKRSGWRAFVDQWLHSLSHRQGGTFKWKVKSPASKNHGAWRGPLKFLVLFQKFLFQWT